MSRTVGPIADMLISKRLTLATAESCSGGLLGHALTSLPGASSYYLGGVIVYSDDSKTDILGVPRELLARHGAVSAQCALAMAHGVRENFAADLGIAITGIAGPGGGSREKPVGTVFLAAASRGNEMVKRFNIPGGREEVRQGAVQAALEMLAGFLRDEIG